tara:strand:+ start:3051 stop:3176 length:126 start_codon:yes stop_codon:yes gene_type:complete
MNKIILISWAAALITLGVLAHYTQKQIDKQVQLEKAGHNNR